MKRNSVFRDAGTQSSIVGTGLVALDVVYNENQAEPIGRWAGGTCGNVLSILSWLGWSASPVARLKPGSESLAVRKDLKKWGVSLSFVTEEAAGSTPIILQYIHRGDDGEVFHRFRMRCPVCGTRLPSFRPITGAAVTEMAPDLPEADVFFFDRTSRGILDLAAHYHDRGAVIVFEPSAVGEQRHFASALEMAHIVKFSDQRIKASEIGLPDRCPSLLIETNGRNGLKYRCRFGNYRTSTWQLVPAFKIPDVRDAAGSGDWCAAGLIYQLASCGIRTFKRHRKQDVLSAIRLGQAMSAWNCRFEGARGGMYRKSITEFRADIEGILGGVISGRPISMPLRSTLSEFACIGCRENR